MKKNNISRKYDGTALFGSILGTLFMTAKNSNRQVQKSDLSKNLRRA
ncbi:MAG: hypothetical protein ACFFFH_08760 [Candidatus Thorarchaeota archaeon]